MAVTRADVARRAGVSPAVVSYVLNPGMRPVSAETRQRVLAAIEELGYRPNAIAQSLRRGPTRTLGLLLPDHANPFFSELAAAIEDRAFERGYVLLVGSTSEDPQREMTYLNKFLDRQVDGLILIVSQDETCLAAQQSATPVVALDRFPPAADISSIQTDGKRGAEEAITHLADLGHRHIGIISGPEGLPVAMERLQMWRAAAATRPEIECRAQCAAPYTREGGYVAMGELLKSEVTAVVTACDVHAVGALSAIRDMGLAVPEDISLISYDGTGIARYTLPPLTVVSQPIELMGQRAVDRLIAQIAGEVHEDIHEYLEPHFDVRSSTGPLRESGHAVGEAGRR
ncbi:LacI family DNA-binding transcriptional regulator [Trueperella sp. LYQ141]|uniref:LacI family DNA-binding transcriptional regulator n=1 Tax=Trueperella sp. LYQ141 TaxID=3391058 RepID=UPI003983ADAB